MLLFFTILKAQNNENEIDRYQYSDFLSKTYYNFNIGLIKYPFDNSYLSNGFTSEKITKPSLSISALLGYKITNKYHIQLGTVSAIEKINFHNINNDGNDNTVRINLWFLLLKRSIKLNDNISVYLNAGIASVNRTVSPELKEEIYKNSNYASLILGTGYEYKISDKWDMVFNVLYFPENIIEKNPYTLQVSAGVNYNIKKMDDEKIKERYKERYHFPENLLQVGYTNYVKNMTIHNFFANKDGNGVIPVFWRGSARSTQALYLSYQRNVFHTQKRFSMDWGVNWTSMKSSENKTQIHAISFSPIFRFWLFRSSSLDFYTTYSIMGPTYISETSIDNIEIGEHFIYHDFINIGFLAGKSKNINIEFKITHYSNGEIFNQNSGLDIPILFNVGWAW